MSWGDRKCEKCGKPSGGDYYCQRCYKLLKRTENVKKLDKFTIKKETTGGT
jgi:hypothetical protein